MSTTHEYEVAERMSAFLQIVQKVSIVVFSMFVAYMILTIADPDKVFHPLPILIGMTAALGAFSFGRTLSVPVNEIKNIRGKEALRRVSAEARMVAPTRTIHSRYAGLGTY